MKRANMQRTKTNAEFFQMGHFAFRSGKAAVPALDSAMMTALEGMPVGSGAAKALEAWLNGWHTANALAD